jgi:hypothetical protein
MVKINNAPPPSRRKGKSEDETARNAGRIECGTQERQEKRPAASECGGGPGWEPTKPTKNTKTSQAGIGAGKSFSFPFYFSL